MRKEDCLASLTRHRAIERLEFDLQRIPEPAHYSAHRLGQYVPFRFLYDVNDDLDAAYIVEIRARLRPIRDAANRLVARCQIALLRLGGVDVPNPADNADLQMLAGLRAHLINALQANIAMNIVRKQSSDEALVILQNTIAEAGISEKSFASFLDQRDAYVLANVRLRNALRAFRA